MPPEGIRRRKRPRFFDIVFVPVGEGEAPKSIRTSRIGLTLVLAMAFLICCAFVFMVLVYSPLAMYVPIPNAALERRYGERISTLQEQLIALDHDVMLLKDYNQQMRKVLGEGSTGDSLTGRGGTSMVVEGNSQPPESHAPSPDSYASPAQGGESMDEASGGIDLEGTVGSAASIITSSEAGKGVFPLLKPVEGIVSQGFEPAQSHFGIDIAGKLGTPVSAAADGYVIFAGWTYNDGNMVIVAHEGGYLTVYKHNQGLLVSATSTVRRGEPVALLGNSGHTSSGPHLHFELWKDGKPRDPSLYLLGTGNVQ